MTSNVTNVMAFRVMANQLHSSAAVWYVSSTTVSIAGPLSILFLDVKVTAQCLRTFLIEKSTDWTSHLDLSNSMIAVLAFKLAYFWIILS